MSWKKQIHNEILEFSWGYISYNSFDEIPELTFFVSDELQPETAIVIKNEEDVTYFILNGDHREELELRAQHSLKACLEYYRENKKLASSWSADQLEKLFEKLKGLGDV